MLDTELTRMAAGRNTGRPDSHCDPLSQVLEMFKELVRSVEKMKS